MRALGWSLVQKALRRTTRALIGALLATLVANAAAGAAPASAAGVLPFVWVGAVHLAPYPCNGPGAPSATFLLSPSSHYGADCVAVPVALETFQASLTGLVQYDEPCPGPVVGGAFGGETIWAKAGTFEWYRVGLVAVVTVFDAGSPLPTGGGVGTFMPLDPIPPGSCLAGGTMDAEIAVIGAD